MITIIDERTKQYKKSFINPCIVSELTLKSTEFNTTLLPKYINKYHGKVRDSYICEDFVVLITTDRQSAFDRQISSIPYKGQVLNLTSSWWFNQTEDIVPNHIISVPHPNVTIGKKCTVFPVEFVMRGYITGSTSTSIWTNYSKGIRNYCGHQLPEGLVKNQKLDKNILTPTTKDDLHDELISAEEVVTSGRMSQQDWDICSSYAEKLFAFGQLKSAEHDLILVDTKYEFGKDEHGNIILIDEIHTPDSSRYWILSSYQERFSNSKEPENIDKEFLRRWYVDHCDPYNDKTIPDAPIDLVEELSRRYLMLYEVITGEIFDFNNSKSSTSQSIEETLNNYFNK